MGITNTDDDIANNKNVNEPQKTRKEEFNEKQQRNMLRKLNEY